MFFALVFFVCVCAMVSSLCVYMCIVCVRAWVCACALLMLFNLAFCCCSLSLSIFLNPCLFAFSYLPVCLLSERAGMKWEEGGGTYDLGGEEGGVTCSLAASKVIRIYCIEITSHSIRNKNKQTCPTETSQPRNQIYLRLRSRVSSSASMKRPSRDSAYECCRSQTLTVSCPYSSQSFHPQILQKPPSL